MKSREGELLFLYIIFDLVILNTVLFFLFNFTNSLPGLSLHDQNAYYMHANLSWIITYFLFTKKNLYLRDGFINRIKRITIRISIFVVIALLLAYFFMPRSTYSRVFLFKYAFGFYMGKLLFYYCLYEYLSYKRKKGYHVNRTIIVGLNNTGKLLGRIIDVNPMLGYDFIGFVSDKEVQEPSLLGKVEELEEIIKKHNVEIIFVTLALFHGEDNSKEFLRMCNRLGVRLRFVPEHQQWFRNKINAESVGRLVILNPQEMPLDDIESRFFKRLFDIVFSTLVILLVLSWLVPLIALLSLLSSPGPVFFVQKRTGIVNREFNCFKFRSMQVNNDSDNKQATANDNRITALGKFLRKSNIDEFPQFLNVFMGDMSVVGPRPHMVKHTEMYNKLIENYLQRHYIRPGVTGWAQVNGYRGETNELWKMQKRVDYDMEYLENWNYWWDIKIIFQTIFGKDVKKNAC